MKKTTVLSAILATMVFSHSAEAQGKFNFRLGGSFPLGEFAEDDINNNEAGGGLSLNEHMSVGLHYYALGQPSTDYRITNNINFDLTEGTVKQRVQIVALTLGVTF